MHPRRVISGLLSLAMMVGPCTAWLPAAAAASPQESLTLRTEQTATGSIALTLSFDLPQRADEVKSRDIRLTLTGSDKNITVSLKDGSATGADGLSVTTEALNTQGAPLTTEQQLGAYTAVVSGLPVGEYTMTVTGTGYASRTTPVTLRDYSQHVLMSTADGSFSLGDVTGDGAVTSADRAALDEQLGKTSALDTYDLNGDGVVDVTDLSYVNKMMDLEAEPRILSTTAIVSPAVDESAVTFTEGSAADLFTGETAVTLTALSRPVPLLWRPRTGRSSPFPLTSPPPKGSTPWAGWPVRTW